MNSSWKLCQLLIFVLATFIDEGISIKCWECNSAFDPQCGDPFDNTTMSFVDCNSQQLEHLPGVKATMCRKIRQRVSGQLKIIRGCAFLGEPGVGGNEKLCLAPMASSPKIAMEYCTCSSKDGCNAGSKVYSNQFAILFGGILTCLVGCLYNML